MMSKEEVIQGLNEDLAAEWGTIIRYTHQAGHSFSLARVEVREIFGEG